MQLPIEEDYRVIHQFYENFEQCYSHVEELAIHLENHPSDHAALDKLAQEIQNAVMHAINCNIAPMVEPLETLLKTITLLQKRDIYPATFTEIFMLFMDRFLMMSRQAVEHSGVEFELIQEVQNGIKPLAQTDSLDSLHEVFSKVTHALVGRFDQSNTDIPGVELFEKPAHVIEPPKSTKPPTSKHKSLFQILGCTIDERHQFWKGRCEFILPIAIGMNALANNAVKLDQLEAAVYLHDFPMVRLSDEILYKKKLTEEEFNKIKEHPILAYEMALALGDYADCAQIVYQHHERPDGHGYPEGIKGGAICDGAKILAICDAFHAMTHVRPHKEFRRSIIRAIAEINACAGTQFDAEWVTQFNVIVRTQRIAKAI